MRGYAPCRLPSKRVPLPARLSARRGGGMPEVLRGFFITFRARVYAGSGERV